MKLIVILMFALTFLDKMKQSKSESSDLQCRKVTPSSKFKVCNILRFLNIDSYEYTLLRQNFYKLEQYCKNCPTVFTCKHVKIVKIVVLKFYALYVQMTKNK